MNSIAVSQSVAPVVVAGLYVTELCSLVQEADCTSKKNPRSKTKNSQNTAVLNVKSGFIYLVRLFSESKKINGLLAQYTSFIL